MSGHCSALPPDSSRETSERGWGAENVGRLKEMEELLKEHIHFPLTEGLH